MKTKKIGLHQKRNTFFPQNQVKTKKKKVFTKNGTLFSSNSSEDLRLDAHRNQTIGGDADEDPTQIIGGDAAKLLGGDISPPGFGTPDYKLKAEFHIFVILARKEIQYLLKKADI